VVRAKVISGPSLYRRSVGSAAVAAGTIDVMLYPGAIRAVLTRPSLWLEAVLTVLAVAPHRWWRSGLPRPEPSYAAWRAAAAYGSPDAAVAPDDLVAYLRWRKRQRAARGSRGV
jgi:hypothetical protein